MKTIFWLFTGFLLGFVFVSIAGRRTKGGRTLMAIGIVVGAWFYIPLAFTGNADLNGLLMEVVGAALFTAMAWTGVRYSVWWLIAGWGTHILWDVGLHLIGHGNEFIDSWYPLFCMMFDLVVAIYLLFFMKQEKRSVSARIVG